MTVWFVTNVVGVVEVVKAKIKVPKEKKKMRRQRNKVVEVGKDVYDAVMKGWLMQRRWNKESVGVVTVDGEEKLDGYAEKEDTMHEAVAYDDVSGVQLDPKEVLRARIEEVEWMRKKGVYRKITRQEAKRRGMKIVKSRWVDINKGDGVHPEYRSRLVLSLIHI